MHAVNENYIVNGNDQRIDANILYKFNGLRIDAYILYKINGQRIDKCVNKSKYLYFRVSWLVLSFKFKENIKEIQKSLKYTFPRSISKKTKQKKSEILFYDKFLSTT